MYSFLSECKLLGIRICIKRPTRGGAAVVLTPPERLAPSFLQRFSYCSCRACRGELRACADESDHPDLLFCAVANHGHGR
jgi:hypothetical protein